MDPSALVRTLRTALLAAPLPLALPGTWELRARRTQLLEQLDDYLMPRLSAPDRPLLVVVGGPTGVGKSTLVNTLVGEVVSQSSMIRPTTRSPVLVHHPDDAAWFGRDGILPAFDRVERATQDPGSLQLVATAAVPPGVALLDAPDFDSIDLTNRALATRLLAAADLWLFVTSAARYADQLPWEQLTIARDRDTPLLVVMNRIQPEDLATVSADLTAQLDARGIGRGKLVLVEHGPVEAGLLRSPQVAEIRGALDELSASLPTRRSIARQCVAGALAQAAAVSTAVAVAADRQVAAIGELLGVVDDAYESARESLLAALSDDAVLPVERGTPASECALDLAVAELVVDHAAAATAEAARRLRATGRLDALLSWTEDDLTRPCPRLAARARRAVAVWRRGLDAEPSAEAAQAGIRALAADLLARERDRYLEPVRGWRLTPAAPERLRAAAGALVVSAAADRTEKCRTPGP